MIPRSKFSYLDQLDDEAPTPVEPEVNQTDSHDELADAMFALFSGKELTPYQRALLQHHAADPSS